MITEADLSGKPGELTFHLEYERQEAMKSEMGQSDGDEEG